MNKYKLKMKTPTGLGNEYVYVYATSNFERYLNKHNLKYARDITKDYQLTDRFKQLQQKVNQLEKDKTHLIEIISGLINYVKDTYDEDLTNKTAEVMEMVLDKVGGSNE